MGKHAVKETPEVFGRPVRGSIDRGSAPVEQHDPQKFIDALDELLEVPGVSSAVLVGYVPYFNDGDACIFSTHEYGSGVRLTEDGLVHYGLAGKEDANTGDEWDIYSVIGTEDGPFEYTYEKPSYKRIYSDPSQKELAETIDKFLSVACSGHHDIFLQQNFGSHFLLTATKEGFDVEGYDHD